MKRETTHEAAPVALTRTSERYLFTHRELIAWVETGFLAGTVFRWTDSLLNEALAEAGIQPPRVLVFAEISGDVGADAAVPLASLRAIRVLDADAKARLAELLGASVPTWRDAVSVQVDPSGGADSRGARAVERVQVREPVRHQRLLSGWLCALAAVPPIPSILRAADPKPDPGDQPREHALVRSLQGENESGREARALRCLIDGVVGSRAGRVLPDDVRDRVWHALDRTPPPKDSFLLGEGDVPDGRESERGVSAILQIVREHLSPQDLFHAMKRSDLSNLTPDEHFCAWFVAGCSERARLPERIELSVRATMEMSAFVTAQERGEPVPMPARFSISDEGERPMLRLAGHMGRWSERPLKGLRSWSLADYDRTDVREAAARMALELEWFDAVCVTGSVADVPLRREEGRWVAATEPAWSVTPVGLEIDAWIRALRTRPARSQHLCSAPRCWDARWLERNERGETSVADSQCDVSTSAGDDRTTTEPRRPLAASGEPASDDRTSTGGASVLLGQQGLRLEYPNSTPTRLRLGGATGQTTRAKAPANWLRQPGSVGEASIPGLTYVRDVVDKEHAERLVHGIDSGAWFSVSSGGRRVQHFGYAYDYTGRGVSHAAAVPPMPTWADSLVERLQVEHGLPKFEQLIVNEYVEQQGIAKHTDAASFGDTVAVVSLISAALMVFTPKQGKDRSSRAVGAILEPRSLTILSGDARLRWTHEIPKRKSDPLPSDDTADAGFARGRRVSLTFRTVASRG